MPASESRSLHLHTLDSLIADLSSGRPVEIGAREDFALPDERTRSALEWYRKKGAAAWTAPVSAANGEDLVDAILLAPPELPALPARLANATSRCVRLKKLEAHRFAGLHKFGTPDAAPENYIHEFTPSLTLFEGRNGAAGYQRRIRRSRPYSAGFQVMIALITPDCNRPSSGARILLMLYLSAPR